jgi:hypothetical protein
MDPPILIKEIDNLETIAVSIENNFKKIIEKAHVSNCPERYIQPDFSYGFLQLSGETWQLQRETSKLYEKWYSMALIFIKSYVPEKQKEFADYYKSSETFEGIKDMLQLFSTKKLPHVHGNKINHANFKSCVIVNFIYKFDQQRHILLTIPGIITIKELSIRGIIYATFIDREIDEARYLFDKKHFRAAGAIAGVALEQHLRYLCDKHNLEYRKKETIEPLVQKLYKNEKIDRTQMIEIQYLASIRDKCDHPSDVSQNEVKELIERIQKLLNNLNP